MMVECSMHYDTVQAATEHFVSTTVVAVDDDIAAE